MMESQVELLRMIWENKMAICDVDNKVGRSAKKINRQQPIQGINGLLSILNLQVPVSSKDEFDIFEQKMTDTAFFTDIVSIFF